MTNKLAKLISLPCLFLLTSFSCEAQKQDYVYGEYVEIRGRVMSKPYQISEEASFVAFMLVLTDSLKIGVSDSTNKFSYGREGFIKELHLDLPNTELLPYENQVVTVQGMLVPSENAHHLGPVCLGVEELKRE